MTQTTDIFSAKQRAFYDEPLKDFNMLSGVTGSGKSFCANLKFYKYICEQVPEGSVLLLSGNTEESLYDNIILPLLDIDRNIDWLEYTGVAAKKRLIIRHKDIQIVCTGANNEKSQDRIHGKNVYMWYADEVVKQPKSFVDMALSRCRYVEKGRMRVAPVIWTMNPDSPSHYIKTSYIDNAHKIGGINWFFGFYDNPHMNAEFIEKQKLRYGGVFYERMILGKWILAEGNIYNEFDRSTHIIDIIPYNQIQEWIIGVDWGYENPLAILLIGIDSDDTYYIVDEIYVQHQLIDDSILDVMANWNVYNITSGYGDRSRPEYIVQLQNIIQKVHKNFQMYPGENDVQEGIQEVMRRLKKRNNGRCGLYINKRCVNTIRETENYRWKLNKEGIGKDEPIKENDHCPDAYRYPIYSRRNKFDFGEERLQSKLREKI